MKRVQPRVDAMHVINSDHETVCANAPLVTHAEAVADCIVGRGYLRNIRDEQQGEASDISI
jgi:hypothetical protein